METISDGTYTLARTLSAIQYEEARGFELIAMSPGPSTATIGNKRGPVNYQSFKDLDAPGVQPKPLELVPIGAGAAATALISQKDAAGWDLVVYCQIYVKSQLEQVAAFRKR
jgi:hypothetical protein